MQHGTQDLIYLKVDQKKEYCMKTNKQIAKDVSEGIATISLDLAKFKTNIKASNLITGKITITDFIANINEDDPYAITNLYDNVYTIRDKTQFIYPDSFVSPKTIALLEKYYDIICKVYPELNSLLVKKGCTSCKKNINSRIITNYIVQFGAHNRDVDVLIPVFGLKFIEQLKKMPKNTNEVIVDIPKEENSYLVRQCMNCTKEHIAKAIGLLLEYMKDKIEYETHFWRAIGQLGLAEVECIHIDNVLSQQIREEKRKMLENRLYIPNLEILLKE